MYFLKYSVVLEWDFLSNLPRAYELISANFPSFLFMLLFLSENKGFHCDCDCYIVSKKLTKIISLVCCEDDKISYAETEFNKMELTHFFSRIHSVNRELLPTYF